MNDKSASAEIDERIATMGDWRGEMLGKVRALIRKADPGVVEEVKWRKPSNAMSGVPVWSHGGILDEAAFTALIKAAVAENMAR